jgi:hypothetical protein
MQVCKITKLKEIHLHFFISKLLSIQKTWLSHKTTSCLILSIQSSIESLFTQIRMNHFNNKFRLNHKHRSELDLLLLPPHQNMPFNKLLQNPSIIRSNHLLQFTRKLRYWCLLIKKQIKIHHLRIKWW